MLVRIFLSIGCILTNSHQSSASSSSADIQYELSREWFICIWFVTALKLYCLQLAKSLKFHSDNLFLSNLDNDEDSSQEPEQSVLSFLTWDPSWHFHVARKPRIYFHNLPTINREPHVVVPAIPSLLQDSKLPRPTPHSKTSPNDLSRNATRHNCTACPASYKRRYELYRHRLVHTGVRNHGCHFIGCNKAAPSGFARKDHLRQHLKQVHGVWEVFRIWLLGFDSCLEGSRILTWVFEWLMLVICLEKDFLPRSLKTFLGFSWSHIKLFTVGFYYFQYWFLALMTHRVRRKG